LFNVGEINLKVVVNSVEPKLITGRDQGIDLCALKIGWHKHRASNGKLYLPQAREQRDSPAEGPSAPRFSKRKYLFPGIRASRTKRYWWEGKISRKKSFV
jgi:hypothetical protein